MNFPFFGSVSKNLGAATAPRLPPRPSHPYYPLGLNIPGYVPADQYDRALLGGAFGGSLAFVLIGVYFISRSVTPSLRVGERAVILWFTMCGLLHCFFEGYYVLNHTEIPSQTSPVAQLWKEYSLSDSRYLSSDTTVLCMEAITATIWGPLCFLTAGLILYRHHLRHPFQIIVCMAHLYGCALYYATSFYEDYFLGVQYSRPEPLYFWVYYFGFNLPWIIVPSILLYQSVTSIGRAFAALEKVNSTLRVRASSNGHATRSKKKL